MKLGIVYLAETGGIQSYFVIPDNAAPLDAGSILMNDGEEFITVESDEPPEVMKINPVTLAYVLRDTPTITVTPANATVEAGQTITITGLPVGVLVSAELPEGEAYTTVNDGELIIESMIAGTGVIRIDSALYLKIPDIQVTFT